MFRISRDPITVEGVGEHSAAGAFVTFDGRVRDHNEGQAVLRLEYEAYDELAVSEGERILEEARQRFDVLGIECVHRVGLLEIGDVAVRVGVAAAHRGEAFRACEFVIDEVKRRVPIWKKEYYASGASDWINCHSGEAAMEAEAAYYARQVRLPDLGQEGQSKLKAARVLVVGAGGLGSSALLYLAASGVGKIGISEDDVLSPSNLHRQVLYNWADVGKPKAALAARRLLALNPFVTAEVHARITTDNALAIFQDYDLVLDCTDNFRSKFLLSDAAVAARKPLVQASIYQYEGQLHVYDPKVNSPCLRCTWPEIPAEDCVGSCAEVGVMGVLPGVFGALQASEAIKLIL
ncbi:MAG TPA: ThiF family adenylyltransferase, partial [Fimbriimonadaceae bacterium]|nr:ThiF family adenylyltransferase [Fimbriimonadaceae bacterium]